MFEFTANQPRGLAERVWNISDRVQGSGNTYNLTILPAYAPTAPTGTAPDQSFASGNVMTWVGDDSTKQANYVTVGTPTQKQIKFRLNNIAIKLDPDIQTFSVSDLADRHLRYDCVEVSSGDLGARGDGGIFDSTARVRKYVFPGCRSAHAGAGTCGRGLFTDRGGAGTPAADTSLSVDCGRGVVRTFGTDSATRTRAGGGVHARRAPGAAA